MRWGDKAEAPAPVTKDAMDEYRQSRRGLEVDVLDEILSSRQRAWQVTVGAFGTTLVALALAGFVIYRYSQPVPEHLLVLDKDTGAVQEVSLVKTEKSYGEVIDAYWVAQFVIHFESYDFYSVQADYDAMGLLAASPVAEQYQNRYHWGQTDSVDKRIGDSETTRVHITSVILDREHGIATVRFTTTKQVRQRPLAEAAQYWIATVAYKYEPSLMTARQRYINPLGFRVLSYRVNAEAAAAVGG